MKKSLLLLLMCTLVITAAAPAQERADDLFHWFPQGSYISLTHKNFEALEKTDAHALFQQIFTVSEKKDPGSDNDKKKSLTLGLQEAFGKSEELKIGYEMDKSRLDLPPALKNSVYWVTEGMLLELVDMPNSDKDEPVEVVEISKNRSSISIDKEVGNDKKIAVFRIYDPTTVEQALKAGELADTGKKLLGRKLYSFSLIEGGKREENLLLWIAADGDILVARNRKMLVRMIFAGRGRISGIIDAPLYADLQSIIPELGQIWQIKYSQLLQRAINKAIAEGKVDDEFVGSMVFNNSPMYRVHSLNVDNNVVSVKISVYENSELAESAFENGEENIEKMRADNLSVAVASSRKSPLDAKKKRELRDNLIISTVTLDEKLLTEEQKKSDSLSR